MPGLLKVPMTSPLRGGCLAKEGKENLARGLPVYSREFSTGLDWGQSVFLWAAPMMAWSITVSLGHTSLVLLRTHKNHEGDYSR